MIEKNTVFILGAGASCPYGFPDGRTLKNMVVNNLSNERSDMHKMIYELKVDKPLIAEFCRHLHRCQLASIDAFLERRPEFMEIGKLAIAFELSKCEVEAALFGKNNSWYEYILNKMNAPIEYFGENKVTFLTFNYDRSLEHYLYEALISMTPRSKTAQIDLQLTNIPIIHLYGSLGSLYWQGQKNPRPYKGYTDQAMLSSSSDTIKIISESNKKPKAFERARTIISGAEYSYFLGFGYHDLNMTRLLSHDNLPQNMLGTCYGMGSADVTRLKLSWGINLKNLNNIDFLQNHVDWHHIQTSPEDYF